MIKIGEFSKLVQVPVPTLRYYDQVGLLKPIEVDRFTGYRYYSTSQLPRLHRILALKGLGFSLEQVAIVLDEGLTPEQMRGMLRLRHAQISQQLAEVRGQLLEVEARLQQIEREDQLPSYDVIVKQVEPLLVASLRTILPSHSAVGTLFGEVYEAIRPYVDKALAPHPEQGGQTLVLFYDTEFKAQDVDGAAAFMLRCRIPESGRVKVYELPAATMAATVHHGSYATIGQAHEAILRWIETNGYQIVGPDRELNVYHGQPIRHDDPSYITEIQYPVEQRGKERMKSTEPKLDERVEQPYMGIRTQVSMSEMSKGIIPQLLDETFAWIEQRGVAPSGAPFIRCHVIDMAGKMDIELGVPISNAVAGDSRVAAGTLPRGRYASLIYTGVKNGIKGNKALLDWGAEHGLTWDTYESPNGDGFGARYESFLTDPDEEPSQDKWETEVAIRLAD